MLIKRLLETFAPALNEARRDGGGPPGCDARAGGAVPDDASLVRGSGDPARAPAGRRIYAIGDVHGRADLLDALLARIDADAGATRPILVLLGDYVDRGGDARAVLERLIGLPADRYEIACLRGNHEAALLDFLERPETGPFWMQIGGGDTLVSYGVTPPPRGAGPQDFEAAHRAFVAALPPDHLSFLQALPVTARFGDYLFVHAGLRPGRDLAAQAEDDLLCIREPFLNGKGRWPFVIVHGHSPVERGYCDHRRIGVDTGAYATGRLCAVRLEREDVSFLST
jgi:serine/threonine protein phosphatase 1